MKEKDLDKNLETLIIEGLIKEAEQENVDFAMAMRLMSDEEFKDMVTEPEFEGLSSGIRFSSVTEVPFRTPVFEDNEAYAATVEDKITDSPTIHENQDKDADKDNSENKVSDVEIAKLCDTALDMSEAYIDSLTDGFDFSTASLDEIMKELPTLKSKYNASIIKSFDRPQYQDEYLKAAWTLTVAYLKLHKKDEAVDLLIKLESQSKGTPFGEHCADLLKKLKG